MLLDQSILVSYSLYHSRLPTSTLPEYCTVVKRAYLQAARVIPRFIDDRRGEHADHLHLFDFPNPQVPQLQPNDDTATPLYHHFSNYNSVHSIIVLNRVCIETANALVKNHTLRIASHQSDLQLYRRRQR